MLKPASTLFFICLLFSYQFLYSQEERCGIEHRISNMITTDSSLLKTMQNAQKRLLTKIKENDYSKSGTKSIPVVFHIVWHEEWENVSTDKILKQLTIINDFFKSTEQNIEQIPLEFQSVIGHPNIEFCLALETPDGQPTNGIIRQYSPNNQIGQTDNLFYTSLGGSSAWDTEKYLNIWIVESINNRGFAFFPWMATKDIDGIVLGTKEISELGEPGYGGKVAIHEIGHYLGLSHIWGNSIPSNDEDCINDDGIEDTPYQWIWTPQCPSPNSTDLPHSCGSNDMYVNFMDYTEDKCLLMFTKQQSDFMLASLAEYRSGLVSNGLACTPYEQELDIYIKSIYPNPSKGLFTIRLENEKASLSQLQLFNSVGQLVLEKEVFLYNGMNLDLSMLNAGMYLLKLASSTHKIIVL